MNVNEPDSLVWSFDKVMVRVSPLATADSVEFGTSKAAVNAAAIASCGAAPSRQRALIVASRPANNPPFPNTTRPAAKAGRLVPFPSVRKRFRPTLLPPAPPDPPSARPFERASCSDLRIVTPTPQLG